MKRLRKLLDEDNYDALHRYLLHGNSECIVVKSKYMPKIRVFASPVRLDYLLWLLIVGFHIVDHPYRF